MRKITKRLTFLLMALFCLVGIKAQETITLSGDISQELDPGVEYSFYDSGGPSANYSNSESYTATFTASGKITINFSVLVTESSSSCNNWDYMLIYDGDATTGTLIGRAQSGCSSATITTGVDYEAESGTLTVEWHSDSSTNKEGWAATIVAEGADTDCAKPTGLTVLPNLTATSATFTWVKGGDEDLWEYLCIPATETVDWNNAEGTEENPLTKESLTPQTAYKFYLRAYCGDEEGQQSNPVSVAFTTPCETLTSFPQTFDFEAEDALGCWTVGNLQSPTSTSYIPSRSSSAKHNGSNGLELKAYYRISTYSTTSADSAYAALPVIDWGANGIQKHTMSFYAKSVGSSATYNKHLYVYATDNLASFTLLKDIELTTSFEQYEIDFRNYVGLGRYIVFFATIPESHSSYSTDYYGHFYIDDIEIYETPACQPLKSISISDVERRSFKVNLTPKAGVALGAYDIVVSDNALDDAALDVASKISISDTNAYRVNGLERNTKYYVYVRANCGTDGVSTWVSDSVVTHALNFCDDVTIGTGTSTDKTPYTYYDYAYTQMIYPASELQAGSISSLAFKRSSGSVTLNNIKVYVGTTSKSSFASSTDWVEESALTLVFNGSVAGGSGVGEDVIPFNAPYLYNGADNLVIAVSNGHGAYSDAHVYYYTSVTGATLTRRADNDPTYADYPGTNAGQSPSSMRPNIRFTICQAQVACPAVTNLAASVLGAGATEEKISWTASSADYLSGYEFILSDTAIVAFSEEELALKETLAADAVEKDLSGLTPITTYHAYLRAVCKAESHDDGESEWEHVEFTTLANCPAVKDLAAVLTAPNAVKLSWNPANAEQDTTFYYIISDTKLDGEGINAPGVTWHYVEALEHSEEGLLYDHDYWAYVASVCGGSHSEWDTIEFHTLPSCQAVVSLQAARVAHNLVELTWDKALLATETQWKVGIIGDIIPAQIVSEPKAKIFGLDSETSYEAYVIALCSELDHSDSTKVSFATAEDPGACQNLGTGATAQNQFPLGGYYHYSYTQQLYTADELGHGAGDILSVAYEYMYSTSTTRNIAIYMANTDATSLSSAYVQDGFVEVLPAQNITFDNSDTWFSINLATPFAYTGGNLVVAVLMTKDAAESSYSGTSRFYGTSCSGLSRYSMEDYSPITVVDGATTSSGTAGSNRANMQFCFEAKTCPDVKALATSDITKESAHISWEPMGSEVQWNVFLSDTLVEDFSAITSTVIGKLDTVFSGLGDDADYYAYVQPVCVGADSWAHKGFRTIASCLAQKDLGIAHEADSITAHTAKLVWTDPNAVRAGDYTVAYGLKDSIDFDKPASYQTLASSDTFALIGNLIPETEYQFAVKANCGGSDESRYSELSAAFKTAIGCFKPSSSPVIPDSTITATTAIVHWADEHDAPAYKVAYGLYDEFDINYDTAHIIVSATDTFKLLEGLQPNSRYKVMVKANCGAIDGESQWTWSSDFYTQCSAAELPYSEGFESAADFRCWTVGNMQSSSSSYIPQRSTSAKHDGSYGLQLYAYKYSSTVADSSYAILPNLNIVDDINKYSIAFYAKSSGSSGSYNKHLYVGLVNDKKEMSSFTQVGDVVVNSTMTRYEVSLDGYTGDGKYLVLLAEIRKDTTVGTYGTLYGQFYVDDLEVFKTPTCYPLKSISFSEVERRSVKVTINPIDGKELASNNELVYSVSRLDEAALDGADKVLLHDTNAVAIGNLTRDTKYYIYVRANCGGEDGVSAWVEDSVKTLSLDVCEGVIGDGTGTARYPFTYYNYSYTQTIYTADNFANAGVINSMYLQRSAGSSAMDNIRIYLGVTDKAQFSSTSDWVAEEDLTLVFDGSIAACENVPGEDEIIFTTPYNYDGQSNLVLAISNAVGTYSNIHSYYYTTVAGTFLHRQNDDAPSYANYPSEAGVLDGYRVNVRFGLCVQSATCPAVTGLTSELPGDGTSVAIVRWVKPDADYFGSYEAILSESPITDFSAAVATHTGIAYDSIKFEGLTPSTDYYVYIRTICNGEGQDDGMSTWSEEVHFKTLANCPAPVNLTAELEAANKVLIEWGLALPDQTKAFRYVLSNEALTEAQLDAVDGKIPVNDTTAIEIDNLMNDVEYHFYLQSICGDDYSPFVEATFMTPISCQKVVNLAATRIAHNLIELSWASAQFATEAQWEVGIVGNEANAQVVSERSALIFGLTPETAYQAYVKAICSDTEESDLTTLDFTTAAAPGNCQTIGTGSSSSYGPVCGYYGYERHGYIFTPVDGLSAGKILSIAWHYTGASTVPAKIYLKNTTETSFVTSVSWNSLVGDATLVYDASLTTFSGWVEIDITDFDYTGDNLMVLVASSYGGSGGSSSYAYNTTNSGNASCHVYAKKDNSMDDDALISSFSSKGVNGERHNIQFCFEAKACPNVTALAASDITKNSANISWEPMGSETSWNVFVSDTVVVDFSAVDPVVISVASALSHSFNGLSADKTYYAYVQPACGGDDWSNINFTTMPSCYAPSNLNVDPSTITSSGATLIWEDTNTPAAGSYIVAYGLASVFDLDDNTSYQTEFANDLSVVLSGLNASSVYKAAVKCDCGAEGPSAFGSVISFTTACGNITSLPWSENFNSLTSGIPNCWDNEEGTTTTASYKWNYYASGHDGACLRFNSYSNGSGNTNFLATPTIELSAAAELSFWCKNPAGGDYEVLISADGGEKESLLTGLTGISDWTEQTVDLSGYKGQAVVIYFKGTSNWGSDYSGCYLDLDDVQVTVKSGPTALDNIRVDESGVQKILLNNHLYIIREGVWYDAAGRLIEK